MIELPENHITLASCDEIRQLCLPLTKHQITFFDYFRVYKDGGRSILTNDALRLRQVLSIEKAEAVAYGDSLNELKSGYFLWDHAAELLPNRFRNLFLEKKRISRENFSIDHGLTIFKNTKDYCDYYNFASTPSNSGIINFYINNFDYFENFILYFSENANSLLQTSYSNKVYFPNAKQLIRNVNFIPTSDSDKHGINEIKPKRYYLNNDLKNRYLTHQEFTCASHVIQGHSIKESAKLLNISPRTVEFYLNEVKQKLSAKNLIEMAAKLVQHFPNII